MDSKKITLNVFFLAFIATIIVALPGCKDDSKDNGPKSFAEKVIGKWNVTESYEKIDGEWVGLFGTGDKGWYEFRSDGTLSAYQASSEGEHSAEMKWSVDEATGIFTFTQGNWQSEPLKAVFESDDRFFFLYTTSFDPTGQSRTGEFKDVQERVKP